jgi:hypothetical protein
MAMFHLPSSSIVAVGRACAIVENTDLREQSYGPAKSARRLNRRSVSSCSAVSHRVRLCRGTSAAAVTMTLRSVE